MLHLNSYSSPLLLLFLLSSLWQALDSQDHSFLTEITMQVACVILNVLIHIEQNSTEWSGMEWNGIIQYETGGVNFNNVFHLTQIYLKYHFYISSI